MQHHESCVLTETEEILDRLLSMQRRNTLVTAIPDGQPCGFITTIVEVLPQEGLLALEASADERLNAAVLGAKNVDFSAQVDGITARFSADWVKQVMFDGHTVLTIAMPASLYWLQRRAFHRIPLPYFSQIKCRIPIPDEMVGEFDVLDLSLRGLALEDSLGQFDEVSDVGARFMNCSLYAPRVKNEPFGLSLRNIMRVRGSEGRHDSWRIGFEFLDVSRRFEEGVQKLMAELEAKRREAERLVRDKP